VSGQELPLVFGNKRHGVKRLQESEQFLRGFGLEEESSESPIFCIITSVHLIKCLRNYAMPLLERFHYMEEVLGAHLPHTIRQNLSKE